MIMHLAVGQRYTGVREDRKRVEMVQIMCQESRVFLPKGHKATHSQDMSKLTCKDCLAHLIAHFEKQIEEARASMATAVEHKTTFQITLRARRNEELRKWISERPDPEVLERIKHG